jgi:hypothetical protein
MDTYALDCYQASREEPQVRIIARLRTAIRNQDEIGIEVFLRILEERS